MKNKILTILFWVIFGIFLILATIIESVCDWFNMRFGVSFEEILFTVTSPLKGSDVSFFDEAVEYVMPSIITALLILVVILLLFIALYNIVNIQLDITIGNFKRKIEFHKIYQTICLIVVFISCFNSVSYAFDSLQLGQYISRKLDATTVYEDYYVNPPNTEISSGNNTKI